MVDLSRVRRGGVLGPFADGFAEALTAAGYTPHGARKQLHLLAHLSRWLDSEGLEPAGLDGQAIGRFFAERRAAGYSKQLSVRASEPLMGYLRGVRVVPAAGPSRCDGPVGELLAGYRRYLVLERGCCRSRPAVTRSTSMRASSGRAGSTSGMWMARRSVAFVVATCPSQSRSSAKRTIKALRSLLRFLHAEGHIDRPLAHAVPAASGWRLAPLPKRLEPEQVGRLLASCDRSSVVGRRDFGVVMVLARLGLRAGEVAGLTLDDVDWRAGEIVVHGKHARVDRLPLPVDVGEAIVAYLQTGRPAGAVDRGLFVRVRAPHHTVSRAGVSKIVHDAGLRAGLGSIGAHQLRHARERDPAGGRVAAGDRPGPPPPTSRGDRDLREGRPRRAAGDRGAVAGSGGMSPLHDHLAEYIAVRRALGYRLDRQEKLLGRFLDELEARGVETITTAVDPREPFFERRLELVAVRRGNEAGVCDWCLSGADEDLAVA